MAHKKVNLPQKICPICLRPFAWRKKWHNNWEHVLYCSERCRRNAKPIANEPQSKSTTRR
ncbi:DUF2256 domain-containing protein [Thiomicrorhabdus aquaedulcis]|uniref:DUF2256 domain-containing protein n=1 Tax=Thiomicrorhabdus aquaedulcis TaxID=2211106 RepID=UPI000FDAD668|nr:DUF2256 domain-containing protein [Thiomicrorhabdus aquaedulcis]